MDKVKAVLPIPGRAATIIKSLFCQPDVSLSTPKNPGVGFYTKYGDGGVDLSPIADLMKTEVRALAKTVGVSDAILKAPPTDGLWDDDRNDEDQLGATYEELEWAMKQHQSGKVADDFVGKELRIMSTFLKHHNTNKHKMNPIPVCEIPKHLI